MLIAYTKIYSLSLKVSFKALVSAVGSFINNYEVLLIKFVLVSRSMVGAASLQFM